MNENSSYSGDSTPPERHIIDIAEEQREVLDHERANTESNDSVESQGGVDA
jgi:hypothetical protein